MNLLRVLLSALTIFVGVWELFHQGFQEVGASGHYFDDELHSDLKYKLLSYRELERPHTIVTAGRHVLLQTATDTASGVIDDENGIKHRVVLPGLVVSGLGHYLFSESQAAKTGLSTIIDSRPCLEQGQHALPLQQLDKNRDTFSFGLGFVFAPMTSEPSGNTTALYALQPTRGCLAQKNRTRQLLKFKDPLGFQ